MPKRFSYALFLAFTLTTGCSAMHGDPKHPTMNPHPIKRYEVTATADAPGPWDSVRGSLVFQVTNRQCVPQDSFTGGQNVPTVGMYFEMKDVGEKNWKGYFYSDALQDADYFGLGVCHWGVAQASAAFTVHNEDFVPGSGIESITPYTEYFMKREFLDPSFTGDGALTSSADNPKVVKHPDAYFPITVTVKQATP